MPSLDEVLANMQPEDAVEVDFDNYKDSAEFPPPVPRGEYTLIAGKPDFDSRDGNIIAVFHHEISGGEYDKRKMMYDRLSTKTFDREGTKVSTAADHLRAIGSDAHPKTIREWGQALDATEGKPWKGVLDWEGSCETCRKAAEEQHGGGANIPRAERKTFTINGERNFPPNPSGGKLTSNVPCHKCGQPSIEARNRVVRRIPASS